MVHCKGSLRLERICTWGAPPVEKLSTSRLTSSWETSPACWVVMPVFIRETTSVTLSPLRMLLAGLPPDRT